MSSETTLDPGLNPALERWIDDTIRRRTEARLREVLQRAAEEVRDRYRRYSVESSAAAEIRDHARADEVREPASAAVEPDPMNAALALAAILQQAAGGVGQPSERSWPAPERPAVAPLTDLPSTLPQLRQQSLSAAEAATYLGVNSSRIRQRLLARTLYGFKDGGSWRLPDFQFEDGRTVPGVDQIFPEIRPATSPVAVARWFRLPWADLVVDEENETVVSPRTWLLEGRDPAPVVDQARLL